jgi:hypothetical protein
MMRSWMIGAGAGARAARCEVFFTTVISSSESEEESEGGGGAARCTAFFSRLTGSSGVGGLS